MVAQVKDGRWAASASCGGTAAVKVAFLITVTVAIAYLVIDSSTAAVTVVVSLRYSSRVVLLADNPSGGRRPKLEKLLPVLGKAV